MGEWIFSRWHKNDALRGNREDSQLREEQTADGESAISSTLVREILQNSLDAHARQNPRGPIRVRIAIHDADEAPASSQLRRYFRRFAAIANTPELNVPFTSNGVPRIPCRFLVAEDFGTCGLEGEVSLLEPRGNASEEGFFWFWRNIERSGKTHEQLGSFGIGKSVYQMASALRCMMGLTLRESDGRRYLMGQARLPGPHTYHGIKYHPEGWWCREADAEEDEFLPLPVEDANELDQFSQDWKLTRKDEPGLSIVSPYVPENLTSRPLLQAVCVSFFIPILQGRLEVEIADRPNGSVLLDRVHIEEVCQRETWDGSVRTKRHIPPPIAFAKNCVNQEIPMRETNLVGVRKVPHWDQSSDDPVFPEETLELLRRDFADQKAIGVRVRMGIPRKGTPLCQGTFDIWLLPTGFHEQTGSYYVREFMTIVKMGGCTKKQGLHALVYVPPGPLAQLLAATEGPAHEDWDTSSTKSDLKQWTAWKGRVQFVQNAVKGLTELLKVPVTAPNRELLGDFFSIRRSRTTRRKSRSERTVSAQHGSVRPEAEHKWFRISSYQKGDAVGFQVTRDFEVARPSNTDLEIAVAYDILNGDPLEEWSPLDFQILTKGNASDLSYGGRNASIRPPLESRGNVVILCRIQEDFEFHLCGFDVYRDLFVQVREIRPEGGEEDDL